MNRRSFMAAILATGIAPAIVRASSLMPIFVRSESGIFLPGVVGNYFATPDSALCEITSNLDVRSGWFRWIRTEPAMPGYFSHQDTDTPIEKIEWIPIVPREKIYSVEFKNGILEAAKPSNVIILNVAKQRRLK